MRAFIAGILALAQSAAAAGSLTYLRQLEQWRIEQTGPGSSYGVRTTNGPISITAGELSLPLPGERGQSHRLRMVFEGANRDAIPTPEQPLPGRINYFQGEDPARWRTGVASFSRLRYRGVYPGIDLVFYGSGNQLEYDFVVHASADPRSIRMRIDGIDARDIAIEPGGDLVAGPLRWKKPAVYQEHGGVKTTVEGGFVRRGRRLVGFQLDPYDRRRDLVIDPTLSYSTYLGGAGNEAPHGIAVDSAGNIYVAGGTTTQTLPVTPNALQPAYGGATVGPVQLVAGDAFLAKFSPAGALVYLTYLGGSGDDFALGLALDASGNVWLAGGTSSSNFPVTPNAYQKRYAGSGGNQLMRLGDAFFARIGPAGDLQYASYFGGRNDDLASAIVIDAKGSVYLTGSTSSRDFPVTPGAFQVNFGGGGGENMYPKYGNVVPFDAGDAFVAKFDPTGTQLIFSSYLGGFLDDMATAIAVDPAGNIYVAGSTISGNFPTTAGTLRPTYQGKDTTNNIFWNFGDGFITKFDPTLSRLIYSTYLGGSGDDFLSAMIVDRAGSVYVTGSASAADFPTTKGSAQPVFRGPSHPGGADQLYGDAFVTKLNPVGNGMVFSTFVGGGGDDVGMAIALDPSGNVYVAGLTNSANFPVTTGAVQSAFAGGGKQMVRQNFGDAFLVELDPSGGKILYSTFLGGSADDVASGIALDKNGNVFITGNTVSSDFPVTKNAFQPAFGGIGTVGRFQGDAFLAEISGLNAPVTPPPLPPPSITLTGFQNAASYTAGVASPGMIFVAYGTSMGPGTLTGPTVSGGVLWNNVAGAQLLFDGVAAPIVYVSDKQSSGIVPYEVAGKTTTQVVAVYNGQRSAPLTVNVASAVPGLFSADFTGTGQGAIYNQDGTPNSVFNPANRGDIVVLYGTGEGQTVPLGTDGLIANPVYPKPAQPVSVTIGGVQVSPQDVLYAGAVSNVVEGEIQVNVRVPTNIDAGNQPVVLQIGTASSQANLTVALK
jgi:uncharacterized protein (TIGR03437 family)